MARTRLTHVVRATKHSETSRTSKEMFMRYALRITPDGRHPDGSFRQRFRWPTSEPISTGWLTNSNPK
jgi:hypothetical protein